LPDSSSLILPRSTLAGCIFAAIVRDTRGVALIDADRFNHFPASPLIALNVVLEGETRLAPDGSDLQTVRKAAALAPVTISGAHSSPVTSWNPGTVFAISIGFFPEAWSALTGVSPLLVANRTTSDVPGVLATALDQCAPTRDIRTFWDSFQNALEPKWRAARSDVTRPTLLRSDRLADWARSLTAAAVVSGPGRSLRAAELRLRRWSGQSRQSLSFYASIEKLHAIAITESTDGLAGIAQEAGFADQSHMGRAVRRATGFSPAQLNRLIETEEAFWCYRLFGERF
jgi:hypothetical protein